MLKLLRTMSCDNHMHMTAHNTIGINFKSFVLLAISNTVKKYISVFSPDEDIEPLDSERNKMDSLLITDFELTAHKIIANG